MTPAVPALGQQSAGDTDVCSGRVINIARMQWPSAAILAEIHKHVLTEYFGCSAQVVPGDLSASLSSMATTGQPAIAPEMWITRVAAIWNSMSETQQVRALAPSFSGGSPEGLFVPRHVADAYPDILSLDGLKAAVAAQAATGEKFTFVSCPQNWACSVINRNLIRALGIADGVDLAEPANRFEMDALIGQAVSSDKKIIFYYWQPNALLAQFDMPEIDLGAYDEEAAKCLASRACTAPEVSDFATDDVDIAVSEWMFDAAPQVTSYLARASIPYEIFNGLLAYQAETNAEPEAVAAYFYETEAALWHSWVGLAE
ncbi:MAG: hypothetical protein KDJ19_11335 [Hyphomicrobiaceae bacterium]|nr:hypothetical protein [Hyphomicrobiaceae bacterium]MCC0023648.1 hypothetical protein [Hyphomicrobiaceae bacterium]